MAPSEVLSAILHYKRNIDKISDPPERALKHEDRLLHCINKLYKLPVNVNHLQETGIGRTVNALRKIEGEKGLGDAAKALVAKWKTMVMLQDEEERRQRELTTSAPTAEDIRKIRLIREAELYHANKTDDPGSSRRDHSDRSRKKSKKRSKSDPAHNEKERKRKLSDEGKSSNDDSDSRRHHSKAKKRSHDSYEGENSEEVNQIEKYSPQYVEPKSIKLKEKNTEKTVEKERRSSKDKHESFSIKQEKKHELKTDASNSSPKSQSKSRRPEVNNHEKNEAKKPRVAIRDSEEDEEEGGIDSHSGATFAEALGPMVVKRKKKKFSQSVSASQPNVPSDNIKKEKEPDCKKENKPEKKLEIKLEKDLDMKPEKKLEIKPEKKLEIKTEKLEIKLEKDPENKIEKKSERKAERKSEKQPEIKPEKKSERKPEKQIDIIRPPAEPLEPNLMATLPVPIPHYKPSPIHNLHSQEASRRRIQAEEDALNTIMSNKNQRTKVFSGVKGGLTYVPTLYDFCCRVLQQHLDAIEYTGGIPYSLLKPILDGASPVQLFQFEHFNPYIIEDTDHLWKFHVNKEFRNESRQEFESWRDMYLRCIDEREEKYKAVTANIQKSIQRSAPVRKAKLAYIDIAKPPRNILRKQMKNGTSKPEASRLLGKDNPEAVRVHAPKQLIAKEPPAIKIKPKIAPLMQKTLKSIKMTRFKR